ncbi:MAG: alkaline phosphatase family protein [Paludibacteraceae bacterium]|nr:alkaline phosphatase family protein [Paludibacteraceae bacterium]
MRTPLLAFVLLSAMAVCATPRLTVVIAVDGLRADNIEYMHNYWLPGGLRTLQEEGGKSQLTFDFNVQGDDETLATLLTGVQPSVHGLSLNHCFSRKSQTVYSFFEDKTEQGIGTKEQVSLHNMPVPTLSDMYRLRYGKFTKIYAVGLQPSAALLLGGHSANGCCWLDSNNHKWVTSTCYSTGLPAAADADNISKRKEDSYEMPKCNSMVVDLALRIQQEEQLGKDETPDLLMLQCSVLRPSTTTDCIQGKDEEDMHQALNQYLGFLIEQLQKRVGKTNVQFVVMGIPRHGQSAEQLERVGIPVRSFNLSRAAALTSVYLMAIYGYERWIEGSYGQSVYLNRTLIEEKGLDLQKIERQVADFLMDFDGVQAAYPRHEALLVPELTRGLAKAHTGDVVVSLQPAWRMMADEETETDHVIDSQPDVPLYLLRNDEKATLPTSMRAVRLIQLLLQ